MDVLVFVVWLKEGRFVPSLLEIWLMLVLKAVNGRWVEADKIMALAFLLEKVYGPTRACFAPDRIPWRRRRRAEEAVELKLAEASPQGSAYRFTEEGRMAVERYSLNDPKLRHPFSLIIFIDWNTDALAE